MRPTIAVGPGGYLVWLVFYGLARLICWIVATAYRVVRAIALAIIHRLRRPRPDGVVVPFRR
jgi:uncharacterized protein YqfA (UPF0365 family)